MNVATTSKSLHGDTYCFWIRVSLPYLVSTSYQSYSANATSGLLLTHWTRCSIAFLDLSWTASGSGTSYFDPTGTPSIGLSPSSRRIVILISPISCEEDILFNSESSSARSSGRSETPRFWEEDYDHNTHQTAEEVQTWRGVQMTDRLEARCVHNVWDHVLLEES